MTNQEALLHLTVKAIKEIVGELEQRSYSRIAAHTLKGLNPPGFTIQIEDQTVEGRLVRTVSTIGVIHGMSIYVRPDDPDPKEKMSDMIINS
jgi:hypothetical protein